MRVRRAEQPIRPFDKRECSSGKWPAWQETKTKKRERKGINRRATPKNQGGASDDLGMRRQQERRMESLLRSFVLKMKAAKIKISRAQPAQANTPPVRSLLLGHWLLSTGLQQRGKP